MCRAGSSEYRQRQLPGKLKSSTHFLNFLTLEILVMKYVLEFDAGVGGELLGMKTHFKKFALCEGSGQWGSHISVIQVSFSKTIHFLSLHFKLQ